MTIGQNCSSGESSSEPPACPRPRLPRLAGADGKELLAQDAERMDLNGAPFDGILGAPFCRSYRVVFDVKGGQLHIAPN